MMLREAGANQGLATEAWVGNQYCWAVWKLAGYEQTYPQQLQGKLLTPEVVFDQLKYRYAALACLNVVAPNTVALPSSNKRC